MIRYNRTPHRDPNAKVDRRVAFGLPLTAMEEKIWGFCLEGLAGWEMVERLENTVAPRTVECYIYRILRKLGYRDRYRMMADYIAQLSAEKLKAEESA
jgi:DNA-binding NarL/FixJ family response regulator